MKIIKRSLVSRARKGMIQSLHGQIRTPVFMPIATYGAVKAVEADTMKSLGAEIILSNTYHLWIRPGLQVLRKTKGLHKFMNWNGPLLTDSGGFQVFSLAPMRSLSAEGVTFRSPKDGKKHFLSPKEAIKIQKIIGSDIMMVLDHCPGYPSSQEAILKAVETTTEWAKQSLTYFQKSFPLSSSPRPLLFGIIQGSIYPLLRRKSAKEITALPFDGYAIGGVAVGEPRKYFRKAVREVMPFLPESKPRYLMGLGKPEEIVEAVREGIDMFDCVIPTRNARHGLLYLARNQKFYSFCLWKDKGLEAAFREKLFYKTLNIHRSRFAQDLRAIDPLCDCSTCKHFSRAYLHHLFRVKETLFYRLLTIHNLHFYFSLMKNIRNGI